MKSYTLQKTGGFALILGVIFLTTWSIFWTILLPVKERMNDASLLILNSNWIWISTSAFLGIILMIFGFTTVYSKIYNISGISGLFGYIFIIIAYIFQAAKVSWEVFVYPVIVGYSSSIFLFKERLFFKHPQIILFKNLANFFILIGVVLFCISLIKSKIFPKVAGILVLSGAIIYGAGPMINIYLAIAGVIILSMGCFILGLKMIRN